MRDLRAIARSPLVWVGTTYFAEGFPYSLVRQISSVYFKDHHASLPAIGMTSLMGLPWALKFLWSPYLDQYGTKRRWLLWLEVVLVVSLLCLAGASRTASALSLGAIFFVVTAVLSATHDIAIDGYYLEALDRKGQARFVGYRVMAYRIAMISAAGGIVSLSQYAEWVGSFGCAAALLLVLFIYHLFFLPAVETERVPITRLWGGLVQERVAYRTVSIVCAAAALGYLAVRCGAGEKVFGPLAPHLAHVSPSGLVGMLLLCSLLVLLLLRGRIRDALYTSESFYAKSFLSFLDQKRIGWALAFIVLYRSGESLLLSMCVPFLMDIGINKAQYGLISGTLGIVCSILGALTGGGLIARFTLKRTIWPLTLAQNLTLLLYMAMAFHYRDTGAGTARFGVSLPLVAAVHCFEQFATGLGTAVFSFYLMRCCRPEFKASHFAIVSGIMNIGGSLFGVVSGFLASLLGYWRFFGLSFLASIPGMLLIFFIPFLDEPAS